MTTLRIMLVLFVSVMSIAFGQETGKPKKFIDQKACVEALKTGDYEVYKASDLSKGNLPLDDGEETFRPEAPTCYKMQVVRDRLVAVNGVAWVVQDDTIELLRKNGKTTRRKDCRNPIYDEVGLPPPVAEVPAPPAPKPCNCTPPVTVVEVVLPPWEPTELVAMPPDLPDPPTYNFQTALVWDKERKRWYWKYTPLFCVDVRSPKDLWRPALCAAVAVGGYALAGGFSGGAAVPLVKVPYLVPTVVP